LTIKKVDCLLFDLFTTSITNQLTTIKLSHHLYVADILLINTANAAPLQAGSSLKSSTGAFLDGRPSYGLHTGRINPLAYRKLEGFSFNEVL
jgi:hypothetical protein